MTRNIAEALMQSVTNNDVYAAIINTTSQVCRKNSETYSLYLCINLNGRHNVKMSVPGSYLQVVRISHNYNEI